MKEIPDSKIHGRRKLNSKMTKSQFQKALGVSWNPRLDTLHFKLHGNELKSATKRELVILMAKVQDLLGLLCRFTVQLKILLGTRTMERSVRLGGCVTCISSDKMEQVASRRESAGTGRSSSMLFLFIARSNGVRNSCLLRYFAERLCQNNLYQNSYTIRYCSCVIGDGKDTCSST